MSSIGAKVRSRPAAAASAAARRAVASQSAGVEGAGLGERDREDGAEAVDDVEGEEERDAEAGFLDRDALRRADGVAAPEVEEAADAAGAHVGVDVAGDAGPVTAKSALRMVSWPSFSLEGHRGEQVRRPAGRPRAEVSPASPALEAIEREDAAAVGHPSGAGRRTLAKSAGAARPEVSKAAMPTKAPVKEACSPRPPSSEMTEASSGGAGGRPLAAGAEEELLGRRP